MHSPVFEIGDWVTWKEGDALTNKVKARFKQGPPYRVIGYLPGESGAHDWIRIMIDGNKEHFATDHFVKHSIPEPP